MKDHLMDSEQFTPPRTPRPVVSVGLPVYNGENYLAEALEANLAQTFEDFELLVSDNGSTDGTEEICRAYERRDERVRYSRVAANRGAAANYNRLVHAARGEWFRWASHDDLAEPRLLERLVGHAESHPEAVLVYGKTVLIDADGEHIRRPDDNLDLRQATPHERLSGFARGWGMCNPVFGIIRHADLLDTSLIGPYISSDVTLLAELAIKGQFHEVPEHLFLRRIHEKSSRQGDLTLDEIAAWFDPKQTRAPRLQPRNLVMLRILQSIRDTPLSTTERVRCALAYCRAWSVRVARVRAGALKRRLLATRGSAPVPLSASDTSSPTPGDGTSDADWRADGHKSEDRSTRNAP